MAHKLKAQKVIINGVQQIIVPGSLPGSPEDGMYAIDSFDNKLKVYNEAKSRWLILGDAEDIYFDNSTNGFSSNNTQEAIEESIEIAIEKTRFSIVCTFNGTVGNNTWLGYNELLPGNNVPIIIPKNCILKEITFSYTNTQLLGIPTGSNLIDGRFDLYKNSLTVVSTNVQFTNQASPRLVTEVNLSLLAGDFIVGRWIDQGDNPSDLAIVYFFEVV